jgi:hypothetical protein
MHDEVQDGEHLAEQGGDCRNARTAAAVTGAGGGVRESAA